MANIGNILGSVLQNYANVPQSPAEVEHLSHGEVYGHYHQFVKHMPPGQLYHAHHQAFQQYPQHQQQSLFSELLGALNQHGVNPQQVGINGNYATPENFAQIGQYINQRPDLMQSILGQGGVLSSPIAKMVMAGVMAAASKKL